MVLIYPDTNIWAYLSGQGVKEEDFASALKAKDASLVLSAHAVYELARTFVGKAGSPAGVKLFSTINKLMELDIVCSKEVGELLKEECYAFENDLARIDPLLNEDECKVVKAEVDKLASGIVEDRVKEFIDKRTQFAARTRTEQREHFADRKELQQDLKTVPKSDLATWLQSQTDGPDGAKILSRHLNRMLGPGPTPEYAKGVLRLPAGDASRGLVRADLYSNWRAANRGSNPGDLIDDMLHVLQAIYSDLYVTGESGQKEYAGLLLTARTKVSIYNVKAQTPVGQWLLSRL